MANFLVEFRHSQQPLQQPAGVRKSFSTAVTKDGNLDLSLSKSSKSIVTKSAMSVAEVEVIKEEQDQELSHVPSDNEENEETVDANPVAEES